MADQLGLQRLLQSPESSAPTSTENGHATSANSGDSRFSADKFEEACRRTMEAAKFKEDRQSSLICGPAHQSQQLNLPNWADLDAMLKGSAEGAERLLEVCKEQDPALSAFAERRAIFDCGPQELPSESPSHFPSERTSNFPMDLQRGRTGAESKPLLSFADATIGEAQAMKSKEETPGSADQAQSSLLHLWWGLVQDQVGTLTREIDSLRQANSQMQVRQAEALMQRSDEQTAQVLQMAQEHHTLKTALETEKEERLAASSKIWETLQAEPLRREQLQNSITQLQEKLAAETAARQEAQRWQDEQVNQAMAAIRADIDRFSARTNEAIASLSLSLEEEQKNRSHSRAELAESIQQLRAGIDKETSRLGSVAALLQAHLDSMRGEMAREQEDSVKRHHDLEEAVKRHITSEKYEITRQVKEEMDKASAGLAELFSYQDGQSKRNTDFQEALIRLHSHHEEQELRNRNVDESLQAVRKEVRQHVIEMCAKEREQTLTLLARARQILESDEALRQRLQNLLSCEVVSKDNFLTEIQRIWQVIKPHERVRVISGSRTPSTACVASASRASSSTPRAHSGTRAASVAVQPMATRFSWHSSSSPLRNRSESPSVQGCSLTASQPYSATNSPQSSWRTLPGGSPLDIGNNSQSSLHSMSQMSQRSVCVPPKLVPSSSYQPPVLVVPPVMSCAKEPVRASDSMVMAVPPLSSLRSDSPRH